MAKTLFDTLNSTLNAKPEAQAQDQTEQMQGLLRAKLGKATSAPMGSAPAASNIQEQVANNQTKLQLQAGQQQGAIQAQQQQQQQIGQQAQQQDAMRQLDERSKNSAQQFQMNTDNLLQEFQRGTARLDSEKDRAKAEQLGFNLRLQDEAYLNQLKNSGELSRFQNSLAFGEEMAKSEIGNNTVLLNLGLDAKTLAGADDRTFQQQLAQMSANDAIQMFNEQKEFDKKMAKYKIFSSMVSTGADAYSKSGKSGGGTQGGAQ